MKSVQKQDVPVLQLVRGRTHRRVRFDRLVQSERRTPAVGAIPGPSDFEVHNNLVSIEPAAGDDAAPEPYDGLQLLGRCLAQEYVQILLTYVQALQVGIGDSQRDAEQRVVGVLDALAQLSEASEDFRVRSMLEELRCILSAGVPAEGRGRSRALLTLRTAAHELAGVLNEHG